MSEILTNENFEEKVIKEKKPVLVDFFASWCGPCQVMGPIIDELSEEMGDKAGVYKVDVDQSSELANRYQVMSIPTIIVFKDGKISKQFSGISSKESLSDALK